MPSRWCCVLSLLLVSWVATGGRAADQRFGLVVNTLGAGTVSVNPPGPYAADALVTLTAIPAPGWSFSSWSGSLTGYTTPVSLGINADSTITATFDQDAYLGITGDARNVPEPTFPPACTVLFAQQSTTNLDQTLFDTASIQNAIDSCPAGQAVELSSSAAGDAFLIQPVVLQPGVTLLIDADVTLFGSSNRSDYGCETSCTSLIQVAENTAPGPGSAIMGYGIIDGQGASFWGTEPRPRMIAVGSSSIRADNFTLYKITLQNAPNFNVYGHSNGLIVWGVKIRNPGNSPNTDGIDPSGATNVTIRDSYISTGDDHIAIKGGVDHVANVTIAHNHLYYGHGLSIGSETNAGVENVLATDNVIDQNGCVDCTSSNDIRIKSDSSRGGEVKNILYQDVCVRNASEQSHELVFDPFYTSATGQLIPDIHDIAFHNVHMLDAGGASTLKGYDADHLLTASFDNVVWDQFNPEDFTSAHTSNALITIGPGPVSFRSSLLTRAGSDQNVQVADRTATASQAYDCTGRFVYLAGELFTSTDSVAGGSSITLTSVLQPAIFGAPAPTGSVSVLEGADVVASAPMINRLTRLTLPAVSPGDHTYTARYSGDANYAPMSYGSVSASAR